MKIGLKGRIVVVWEAVPDGKTGIGSRSDIKRVGFPVISRVENVSARHLKNRCALLRHGQKLFGYHLFGYTFYIIACQPDSISIDVVTDFLLRVFQHHFVRTANTIVIDHGKIFIFYEQVITLVLKWGGKGVLFVDSVTIVILLGKPEQPFIISLVPELVQS